MKNLSAREARSHKVTCSQSIGWTSTVPVPTLLFFWFATLAGKTNMKPQGFISHFEKQIIKVTRSFVCCYLFYICHYKLLYAYTTKERRHTVSSQSSNSPWLSLCSDFSLSLFIIPFPEEVTIWLSDFLLGVSGLTRIFPSLSSLQQARLDWNR